MGRASKPGGKGLKARWEGPRSQQGRALEPAERASEPAERASEPAWRAPKCQLGRASELGGKGLEASMERPTSRLRSAIVKLLMDHRVDLAYFCGRVGSATLHCRVYNLSPTFDRPTIIMYEKDGPGPVMVSDTHCPAVHNLGT